MGAKKNFVIDTNVILHDYNCLKNFQENDIYLPIVVLEELDKFKKGNEQINFNAREFVRELDLITDDNLFTKGAPLGEGLGRLFVVAGMVDSPRVRDSFPERIPDHQILSVVDWLSTKKPKMKTILVTKDVNLRMKARSIGLLCEDYINDKVINVDIFEKSNEVFEGIDPALIDRIYSSKEGLDINEFDFKDIIRPNECFVLKSDRSSVLARYNPFAHSICRVNKTRNYGIEPRNAEQSFAFEVLNDPNIKLVALTGKAGTGKTLLAKAVAGEAGVPFFSISGSDFVEMFVGVGASRVRDLFEEAKHNAPCIVFIDEIDAVARRRGTGMGGGHDEREQTLNQLLVEMDGFGVNEGIIVMAATNRVDILDPAILRPGRFDRKVAVGTPDVGGREEILKVHAKNKPLGDDVNLQQLAQTTAGFTGADLENLLNEAAIIAAKENRSFIANKDVKRAFVKVGIGAEKKSRIISDKEKKITAYHEAGHAILFHVLPDVGPVYTVSIIPTGVGAAGYTMPLPEKDEMFATKSRMLQDIMVSLGGRIAEEIIFGDITTGASSDIKKATKTARRMVTRYGMSDNIGVICYDDDDDEVFIGKDLAHAKAHSEEISGEIDKEVKRIIDDCYTKAKDIIMQHENVLHSCAKLLLEKEKINREEFEALFV